jgi:hypothetical protein
LVEAIEERDEGKARKWVGIVTGLLGKASEHLE